MKYHRFELLELFDEEKAIDVEVDIFKYFLKRNNFIFSLYISPHDDFCAISLFYENYKDFIFDIGINKLKKLEVNKKNDDRTILDFFDSKSEYIPVLSVIVKPTISVQFGINEENGNNGPANKIIN